MLARLISYSIAAAAVYAWGWYGIAGIFAAVIAIQIAYRRKTGRWLT